MTKSTRSQVENVLRNAMPIEFVPCTTPGCDHKYCARMDGQPMMRVTAKLEDDDLYALLYVKQVKHLEAIQKHTGFIYGMMIFGLCAAFLIMVLSLGKVI